MRQVLALAVLLILGASAVGIIPEAQALPGIPDPSSPLIVYPHHVQARPGASFSGRIYVRNDGETPIDAYLQTDGTRLWMQWTNYVVVDPHGVRTLYVVMTVNTSAPVAVQKVDFELHDRATDALLETASIVMSVVPEATAPTDLYATVAFTDIGATGGSVSEGGAVDSTITVLNPGPEAVSWPVNVTGPSGWDLHVEPSVLSLSSPNGTGTIHLTGTATHDAVNGTGHITINGGAATFSYVALALEINAKNETSCPDYTPGCPFPEFTCEQAGACANGNMTISFDPPVLDMLPGSSRDVNISVTNSASRAVSLVLQTANANAGIDRLVLRGSTRVDVPRDSTLFVPAYVVAGGATNETLDLIATDIGDLTMPTLPTFAGHLLVRSLDADLLPPTGVTITASALNTTLGTMSTTSIMLHLVNPTPTTHTIPVIVSGGAGPWRQAPSYYCPPSAFCDYSTESPQLASGSVRESIVVVPAASQVDVPLELASSSSETGDTNVTVRIDSATAITIAVHVFPSGSASSQTTNLHLTLAQSAAVGAASVGIVAGAVVVVRRKWPLVGIGLYARIAPQRLLEHPGRRRVREVVEDEPGVNVNEAERRSGLSHGAFVHHLAKLEAAGILTSVEVGQRRALYVAGTAARPESSARTDARIVNAIMARGPSRPADVARELGLSRQAVQYHLPRLIREGKLAVRNGLLHAGA